MHETSSARPWRDVRTVFGDADFVVAEQPLATIATILIRMLPPFADRVDEARRHGLPVTTGQVADLRGVEVIAMGPGEWLMIGDAAVAEAVSVVATWQGTGSDRARPVVLDVSHGHHTFLLSGIAVRDRLSAFVAVDLHPDRFPRRHAAMTAFGSTRCILVRAEGDHAFRLVVDRADAAYVLRLLALDLEDGIPA